MDDYPSDTSTTGVVSLTGTPTSGTIDSNLWDTDLFKVNLTAGQSYIFDLKKTSTAGLADPYLSLYNGADLNYCSYDDDSGGNYNSSLSFTASVSGTYYLEVMDAFDGTGSYTLTGRVDTSAISKNGTNSADNLVGGSGVDRLYGLAGNDRLTGNKGNDLLDGGSGIDTAIYADNWEDYSFTRTSTVVSVEDMWADNGIDNLVSIERLAFRDTKVALDMGVTEAGGKTALLFGAVLGPSSLSNTALVGVILNFFDSGASLMDASSVLVNGGITASLAGGADNHHFAQWLYNNVFASHQTSGFTVASMEGMLNSGKFSQASLLASIAEMPTNQTNVDLVGLYETGMVYF